MKYVNRMAHFIFFGFWRDVVGVIYEGKYISMFRVIVLASLAMVIGAWVGEQFFGKPTEYFNGLLLLLTGNITLLLGNKVVNNKCPRSEEPDPDEWAYEDDIEDSSPVFGQGHIMSTPGAATINAMTPQLPTFSDLDIAPVISSVMDKVRESTTQAVQDQLKNTADQLKDSAMAVVEDQLKNVVPKIVTDQVTKIIKR